MINMNDKIKFSIIVPCYNVSQYIVECIESVLAQTYTNWELLLINDESTDQTLQVITEYERIDQRIRVFNKEHGGLPHTRNYGLDYITGDYLVLLDGDDYFSKNHLELEEKILSGAPCDMLVHNQHTNFTRDAFNPLILFRVPDKKLEEHKKLELIFKRTSYLPAAAVLTTYKVDFINKYNMRYGEQYSCSEDLDFFLGAIYNNPWIEFANHEFYFYRQDNQSAMTKCLTAEMELDRLSIYKKWYDFYDKKKIGDFYTEVVQLKIAHDLKAQVYLCIEMKDKTQKIKVKRFFQNNKYLFSKNGKKGSFDYIYYIEYPVGKLKGFIKKMVER